MSSDTGRTQFSQYMYAANRSLGLWLKAVRVCCYATDYRAMLPINLVTVQSSVPVGGSEADFVREGRSILKCSFTDIHSQSAGLICSTPTHTCCLCTVDVYLCMSGHQCRCLDCPKFHPKRAFRWWKMHTSNTHQTYGIETYGSILYSPHTIERISQALYYSIDLTAMLELSPCLSTQYSQLQQHSHIPTLFGLALHTYIHQITECMQINPTTHRLRQYSDTHALW